MLTNELMKTMKLLHFLQDKRARDQDKTLTIEGTPATSDPAGACRDSTAPASS
jgi:hypothetical protein